MPRTCSHPTNLQTQQPQLTHWARNQKSVRTNGHLGRKTGKSSERQFTKEGQMTYKAWKAHRSHPARQIPEQEAIAHQAGKMKKGGDTPSATSRPPALVHCLGRAQVRGRGAPALGACVSHRPQSLLPRMQVWGSSSRDSRRHHSSLNQHFWHTAVCMNSTQGQTLGDLSSSREQEQQG